jgi:geranylgeranyl pyrophosphate synthase
MEREQIKLLVERYVESARPVPPLSLDELRAHSDSFVARYGIEAIYRDYAAVLINSELWREQLAAVPYERRLLLLPKCLRVEDRCPAPFDEFGLLCKQCGLCSIQDLQEEAERLGYAVLVAEGSAIVMALIQTGKIDAIVGVSCLSVLERAFPFMEAAAIPGVAIPLLQDDCKDTTVDLDWVWDVIHLTSEDRTRRLDLDALRREVKSWFELAVLDEVFDGKPNGTTERIAREWIAREGKRWRPFLTVCTWKALQDDPGLPQPADLRKVAVAVECFHKASLIHDDIEDGDTIRYGEKTLHAEYGVPMALNIGDLLVGEGYRLLSECEAPPEVKERLIRSAAAGHRVLCLGQGAELEWMRAPRPLSALEVLGIFRQKTAPAFQVALELGAAYAGADEEIFNVIAKYSDALGIAYQIRDDLEDWKKAPGADDLAALRPTLPLALAYERTKGENRLMVEAAWRRDPGLEQRGDHLRALLEELSVEQRARGLLDAYKEEAVRSLAAMTHAGVKSLLRRVIGKIFTLEVKGWCSEFEARNAAGREALAQAAR